MSHFGTLISLRAGAADLFKNTTAQIKNNLFLIHLASADLIKNLCLKFGTRRYAKSFEQIEVKTSDLGPH